MGMLKFIAAVLVLVCAVMTPSVQGGCNIDMKSWGWVDTGANLVRSSYIKVEGVSYVDSFNGNFANRGFNVVTLDENTCKASNFAHFDTWASAPAADALADWINGLPDGTHILGVTSDDGFHSLSAKARDTLRSIGVETSGLVYADKLIFHAVKGKTEETKVKIGKNGKESIFYEEKPCCSCDVDLKSWGWRDTGANLVRSSYIRVNGLSYMDSFNGNFAYRGFNLVKLDVKSCTASDNAHFDTWATTHAGDDLAAWINALPDGTHVLGVTSDDGFQNLPESAKTALRSIGVETTGRVYADKLSFHAVKGSPEKTKLKVGKVGEASIYYKGKRCATGAQGYCQNGGVLKINCAGNGFKCQCPEGTTGLFCEQTTEVEVGCTTCDISMKSWGWVDKEANLVRSSYIKVNGVTSIDSFNGNFANRGFNVVTLNVKTCKASNFAHFDTWASIPAGDALANWINGIPDGTHILGVTSDDGFQKISGNAKNALRSIGVETNGLAYADKLIFHAVKGRPAETKVKIGKNGLPSIYCEEKYLVEAT